MRRPKGSGTVSELKGKRYRPFVAKVTIGYEFDPVKLKSVQKYQIIGYAATKKEAEKLLNDFLIKPFNTKNAKMTFKDLFDEYKEVKFNQISDSNRNGYLAAFKSCATIHNCIFRELKAKDLQRIIDTCGKNYPTLKKIKVLFNQLYSYAMQNDLIDRDYSKFVNIEKHKKIKVDLNNSKVFNNHEMKLLWSNSKDPIVQIILMMIYSGVRISEMLNLKKENVNLECQYFDILASKTEAGVRRVPIADCMIPFFSYWLNDSKSKHLIHMPDGTRMTDERFRNRYFYPILSTLGLDHTPHDTRHTCISLLAESKVDPTTIKHIVGHRGTMTLTEAVYIHLSINTLIEAVNQIPIFEEQA